MARIITHQQCTELSPLNAHVKPTEFNVCYNNAINLMLVGLLGIDCFTELQEAIDLAETTPPLEERWAKLLAPQSEKGGGLYQTLAYSIYLFWFRDYANGSVVTKGFQDRNNQFSENVSASDYDKMVNRVTGTAKQFQAITEAFLKENRQDYPCLPKDCETDCEPCKNKSSDMLNFSVA